MASDYGPQRGSRTDNTAAQGNKLDREEKVACVTKIYRSLGLDRRCDELAARYAEDAIAAIDGLEMYATARAFFKSLATNAATRNH